MELRVSSITLIFSFILFIYFYCNQYRTKQKVVSLPCISPIVDVTFEFNGALISVILQDMGTYYYSVNFGSASISNPSSVEVHPVLECPFPSSERQPVWTAGCTHVSHEDGEVTLRTVRK